MIHQWDQLTFLHWSYDPDLVQALLPPGLVVDTFDGKAWVGLVPFMMEVRAPKGPKIPWLSRFCETNVRTYATAPDGTRGVWFLSLDAARLLAVTTAHVSHSLPYYWSEMSYGREEEVVTYDTRRRWPGAGRPTSHVRIRVGDQFASSELSEFDHYLTALWSMHTYRRRSLHNTSANHAPWDLHRVELLELHDELVAASGLPQPTGDPICHWSPGVEVRIGYPHKTRPT